MTSMRTTPRPRASSASSAARRLVPVAAGLVLLTATVLAGTRAAPRVGTAVPAGPAQAQERNDREVPDDPRLREDHVDPFDDGHPAITGLRPALRAALQDAARDADAQGVDMWVTSGRRSLAYQQELLDEAVRRYGSLDEALRFVASPDTSRHVTGDAVDIGPTEADDWMIRHGADHGLCQTYANELWHFELATEPGGTCPAPRADAAG
ncbi:M15 family metallopeptidase [Petropleomorpha daqingensis]|uniref:D-alanyl-D-alanine carboxypeptidase-like core domain-containing protein n=1 Tax=Petropleomorpha daqingensis TaxID=2026353 RepID=A0A853CM13_9ACTN|nr:M15 family metallopeptidase [Petropleomorpha daqingensis]NYJ08221.1 hypothetical protein [Petropleomorpha daqingensis]